MKKRLLLALLVAGSAAPSHAADRTGGLSDKDLASIICFASREAYYQKGRWCACPEDKARNGSLCGSYSANSRSGRPCCNVSEVTQKQINRYRGMFGR
jgi:hypothetical protein